MDAIDEIVAEFLVESHENLDQLDRDLLALEQNPNSRDLLASVFRTIHTIKGTSGFLAFHRLEKLTHVGENLLSRLRDGRIGLTEERSTALLAMVDAVRSLLGDIEQSGVEGDTDHSELIETLSSLLEDGAAAPAPAAEAPAPAAAAAVAAVAEPAEQAEQAPAIQASQAPEAGAGATKTATKRPAAKRTAKKATGGDGGDSVAETPASETPAAAGAGSPTTPDAPPIGEVLVKSGATTPDAVEIARMEQSLGDQRPIGKIMVDHGTATPAAVEGALETQSAHRSVVDSSVRVDVELLDSLMRLVGELVLARNQLVSRLDDERDTAKDSALARSAQRLSLVTSELQEQVMKTRMQPVDAVWSKMPRVVRDLAKQCGRKVRLEMEGRETELDRSVLEAIKDPLTHLVRNAVDHGIETPEELSLIHI